jgi:hypothetical protein
MNAWGWIVIGWLSASIVVGIIWGSLSLRRHRRRYNAKLEAAAACRWHCPVHGYIPDPSITDLGAGKPPFHLGCGQEVRLAPSRVPPNWWEPPKAPP